MLSLLFHSILCWLFLSCHNAFVLSYQETHVQVADEISLHTLEYGDSRSGEAPVVLLVHGFPDLSISWQYQAERLAEEGYFVVTPDLRGFGNSSIPKEGIVAYGRKDLVSDMDALRRHYCGENGSFAMIAGHDWGGSIVWATLDAFGNSETLVVDPRPAIANCAIILNAPHSRVFFKYISNPKQAIKSWYMAYFQIPWLPEFFLAETKALYHMVAMYLEPMRSIQENVPSMDIDRNLAVYKDALTDYDRVRAMLSLYRGTKSGIWRYAGDTSELSLVERLVQWIHGIEFDVKQQDDSCQAPGDEGPPPPDDIKITIPTLVLWGEKDIALSKELASPPADIVTNSEGVEFFDASHFVHWEKPLEIAERMIRFVNAHNEGVEATMNEE